MKRLYERIYIYTWKSTRIITTTPSNERLIRHVDSVLEDNYNSFLLHISDVA
ncbi:unnamed protein product, partial [Rotaria sp. Silwood2]